MLNKVEGTFLALLSSVVHQTPPACLALTQEEWEAVFELARAHNVLPLVFEKASEVESFLNLPISVQYRLQTIAIVASQARRTEAFLKIYKKLILADIHPIVMKGIICRKLYGGYRDHRPSGDEDILIRSSEYERVREILAENGYVPGYENVTASQLEELQQVTFSSEQTGLSMEVHVNPIGRENSLRRQLNDCFRNVFNDCREEMFNDVPVTTMSHTDHMLFLILHAFKHLMAGGFGIRQVMDILLYAEKYGTECDWKYLHGSLTELKADVFLTDLFYIGNQYLGFQMKLLGTPNCPEELLEEILDCGIFGNATQAQRTAVQMTSAAIRGKDERNQSRAKTLFYTIFPDKANMLGWNPELQEKPWLLPICWVKRWGRFFIHNKAYGGNLAADSMKMSRQRIALLKRYGIL